MYKEKYRQGNPYGQQFEAFPQTVAREVVAPYPIEDADEVINPVPVFMSSTSNPQSDSTRSQNDNIVRRQKDPYETPFQYGLGPNLNSSDSLAEIRIPPTASMATGTHYSRDDHVPSLDPMPSIPVSVTAVPPPPPYEESETRILQEKAYRVDSPSQQQRTNVNGSESLEHNVNRFQGAQGDGIFNSAGNPRNFGKPDIIGIGGKVGMAATAGTTGKAGNIGNKAGKGRTGSIKSAESTRSAGSAGSAGSVGNTRHIENTGTGTTGASGRKTETVSGDGGAGEKERDLSEYFPRAIEFYKVYKATVADSTNFTHNVQIKWCETLLEYAFDEEFLCHYNINAEKLKRKLRPDESLKNQKVILGHSFRVLTKLVSQKCGPAMYLMGTLYSHQPYLQIKNKNIVDRNDKKALEYYCRAAKTNHSDACYRAGVCFEYQRGTPPEEFSKEHAMQKAFQYYERGAECCQNTSCMYKLGMFYLYGLSGQQHPLQALHWFKMASEKGDSPQALYELGKIYEFTSLPPQVQGVLTGNDIHRDPATALKYFHKCAMDSDYPLAQWKLGYCYEFGELQLPVIAKKSIAWYAKAALAQPKGNPMAMLALSGWYLTGAPDVLKPNDREAFKWAMKACEASDGKLSRAEYALACYYENGIGCRRDLHQAKAHFETATKLGHVKAKDRLERDF
ncbi:related to Activator of C kinase protein 1 [Zygosaccharomyces bailii]|nr:related to Activator of C kinase protein 1 [Zygosaccharomyces bailii]